MHCPNCGKPADADQQFCRACGMSLETVGQLVARHAATPLDQRKATKAELERELIRKMFTWMTWGMLILGIGVLMVVADKTFAIGSLFKFISTVLILVGVGVTTGGVFQAIKEGISEKKLGDQISAAVDTKSLPTTETPASLPSITERTTQLIPTDDALARERRTKQGDR